MDIFNGLRKNKKERFGVAFLEFMAQLNQGLYNEDPVAWACAKMFLVDWGFNQEEVMQVIDSHCTYSESKKKMSQLEYEQEGEKIYSIISEYIGSSRIDQERFIVQIATIGGLYLTICKETQELLLAMGINYDIPREEVSRLSQKGLAYATWLNTFGIIYAGVKRNEVILPKMTGLPT